MTTEKIPQETSSRNFRTFVKHVDTVERYNSSVEQLLERGQTQEMLLRIVQSKLSERIHSYASQVLRWRQIFDSFDSNGDGVLDENEFRICLEKQNIQFDDIQCLALFAYFDTNYDGLVTNVFLSIDFVVIVFLPVLLNGVNLPIFQWYKTLVEAVLLFPK